MRGTQRELLGETWPYPRRRERDLRLGAVACHRGSRRQAVRIRISRIEIRLPEMQVVDERPEVYCFLTEEHSELVLEPHAGWSVVGLQQGPQAPISCYPHSVWFPQHRTTPSRIAQRRGGGFSPRRRSSSRSL